MSKAEYGQLGSLAFVTRTIRIHQVQKGFDPFGVVHGQLSTAGPTR